MFCWILILLKSYEEGLIRLQHKLGAGVFGCDDYDIYSNATMELLPGVATRSVDVDLHCEYGGKWKTALNNGIFMTVWTAVAGDGKYARYAWTVKVDADTVFLPHRLRPFLVEHQAGFSSGAGVYLNNCVFGLHGPIEVFSKNAVKIWSEQMGHCREHFHRQCGGSCLWGEDKFIDQCLWKVLKSRRIDDFRIMLEDHCNHPPNWASCTDRVVASFHPFKSESAYHDCWSRAVAASKAA